MSRRRAEWWPNRTTPPPASWAYVVEDFLAPDRSREWALAAALFIAEYTDAHRQGPTFDELFTHLLPDTQGVPSRRPEGVSSREQSHARGYFRLYVVRRWRGHNLFAWKTGVYRSLNVRANFARQARQFEQKDAERA